MMKRLGFGLLFAVIGFVVAGVAAYFLILTFSANVHDRSVEAAMTSVFFYGPLGAVAGLVGGLVFGGRRATGVKDVA
jgi:hypothetical protein